VSRWLGGRGIWGDNERDNDVRTLGAIAHRELLAAETAAAQAGIDAGEALAGAWKLLFLGQVSDATGINPFRGEVEYGIANFTEALRVARGVINDAKTALGASVLTIDPASNSVSMEGSKEEGGAEVAAPLALVIDPEDRPASSRWEELGPGHYRVTITFGAGESTYIGVTFPGAKGDSFVTTRALADGEAVTFSRADFSFEDFYLALPAGVISLDPGLFVIKDQARVHMAARVLKDSGDVAFLDETAPAGEASVWVFHVVEASAEEAVKLAQDINGKRRLVR
jgi:hypothetical protein